MGIRDAFERIKTRRLRRQAEQQAPRPTGTGDTYNPILGTQQVRDGEGGTLAVTKSIASGGIGVGTPVQITGSTVDAKPSRPNGDSSSNSAREGRGAPGGGGSSNSFIPPGGGPPASPIPGYNPDTQDRGWVGDGEGGCEFKIWPKGKKPKTGVYETGDECLQENAPGDWVCQAGQCVEAAEGQGRWKFKRECEEALGPLPFEGGQCFGVLYKVKITVGSLYGTNTCEPREPIVYNLIGTGPIGPFTGSIVPTTPYGWTEGVTPAPNNRCAANGVRYLEGEVFLYHAGGQVLFTFDGISDVSNTSPTFDIQIEPLNPEDEDNCGNYPRPCPA